MRIFALCLALLWPFSASAQDTGWGNLDALLLGTLSQTGSMEASFWMPNSEDPAIATEALGVIYVHVPGSAGTVSIHAALFGKTDSGWNFWLPVSGLFGQSPTAPVHGPEGIEISTMVLGPGDARCCPSEEARWRIDRTTGLATRIN